MSKRPTDRSSATGAADAPSIAAPASPNAPKDSSRRKALRVGAVAAGVAVGGVGVRALWSNVRQDARLDGLRRRFRFPSGAALIGRAYLELAPSHRDPQSLEPVLAASARPGALAALIDADLAAGRTLELRGWLVSLTEARLYALLASPQ